MKSFRKLGRVLLMWGLLAAKVHAAPLEGIIPPEVIEFGQSAQVSAGPTVAECEDRFGDYIVYRGLMGYVIWNTADYDPGGRIHRWFMNNCLKNTPCDHLLDYR